MELVWSSSSGVVQPSVNLYGPGPRWVQLVEFFKSLRKGSK